MGREEAWISFSFVFCFFCFCFVFGDEEQGGVVHGGFPRNLGCFGGWIHEGAVPRASQEARGSLARPARLV